MYMQAHKEIPALVFPEQLDKLDSLVRWDRREIQATQDQPEFKDVMVFQALLV
jgi:hypothetical protein